MKKWFDKKIVHSELQLTNKYQLKISIHYITSSKNKYSIVINSFGSLSIQYFTLSFNYYSRYFQTLIPSILHIPCFVVEKQDFILTPSDVVYLSGLNLINIIFANPRSSKMSWVRFYSHVVS